MAALLSPVLWRLNQPDRFDIYSTGIVMIAFRSKLEDCNHDLQKWRESVDNKNSPYREGFNALDANNGAGWQFLSKVRPTAGHVPVRQW